MLHCIVNENANLGNEDGLIVLLPENVGGGGAQGFGPKLNLLVGTLEDLNKNIWIRTIDT